MKMVSFLLKNLLDLFLEYSFNVLLLGFFSAIYKLNGTLRNPKKAVYERGLKEPPLKCLNRQTIVIVGFIYYNMSIAFLR